MGVKRLLPFLEPVTIKTHISQFQGQTAGVDLLSWIYIGCSSLGQEMHENPDSRSFLNYIHLMLDLLQYYHITPICVLDGRWLPRKTEELRRRAILK